MSANISSAHAGRLKSAGIDIGRPVSYAHCDLLTSAAEFLPELQREINGRRFGLLGLLATRRDRQACLDVGGMPGFLSATRHIRDSEWRVAPLPRDLQDRRVEITGPVEWANDCLQCMGRHLGCRAGPIR
jgi:hypothetical protein